MAKLPPLITAAVLESKGVSVYLEVREGIRNTLQIPL